MEKHEIMRMKIKIQQFVIIRSNILVIPKRFHIHFVNFSIEFTISLSSMLLKVSFLFWYKKTSFANVSQMTNLLKK